MRKDFAIKLDKIIQVVYKKTGVNLYTDTKRLRENIDAKKMYVLLATRLTRYSDKIITDMLSIERSSIYNLRYGALDLFETNKEFREDYLYCMTELKDILDYDFTFFLKDYYTKQLAKLESKEVI